MKSNYICFSDLKSVDSQAKNQPNILITVQRNLPFIEVPKIKYFKRITPQAMLPTFSYSFLDNIPKSDTKINWTLKKYTTKLFKSS